MCRFPLHLHLSPLMTMAAAAVTRKAAVIKAAAVAIRIAVVVVTREAAAIKTAAAAVRTEAKTMTSTSYCRLLVLMLALLMSPPLLFLLQLPLKNLRRRLQVLFGSHCRFRLFCISDSCKSLQTTTLSLKIL
jgi:hypothetical protein